MSDENTDAQPAIVPRKSWWCRFPSEDWIVVVRVMSIKVLLFVVAVKSYPIFWDRYRHGLRQSFDGWNHWDALHYQQIAQFGTPRQASPDRFILFPLSIRSVHYITGSHLAADSQETDDFRSNIHKSVYEARISGVSVM
jgi:hypothetical protein